MLIQVIYQENLNHAVGTFSQSMVMILTKLIKHLIWQKKIKNPPQ